MNTGSIKPEDIVQCDVRGDVFFARVRAKGREQDARLRGREIMVLPIGRGGVRIVTARQVVGHYRKAKGSR